MSREFRKHRDALVMVRRNSAKDPKTAAMISKSMGYESFGELECLADAEATDENSQLAGAAAAESEIREMTEEAQRLNVLAEEKRRHLAGLHKGRDTITHKIAEMEALETALSGSLAASPASVATWKQKLSEFWTDPRFVLQDADGYALANHRNLIEAIQAESILVEAWTGALASNTKRLEEARAQLADILAELTASASTEELTLSQ
jgi:chromosome segregation ATPase